MTPVPSGKGTEVKGQSVLRQHENERKVKRLQKQAVVCVTILLSFICLHGRPLSQEDIQ